MRSVINRRMDTLVHRSMAPSSNTAAQECAASRLLKGGRTLLSIAVYPTVDSATKLRDA